MYQLMADWGHPASLPSPLDMIYLPPHLPRIFNHGRRCDYAYAFHASADTVVTKILQQLKRSNTIELSTPAASPREGGGGVLLGILGGGVPQGSSNPDSISDQKM